MIPLFEAMMWAEDPRDSLALFARIRRQIRERCGDIISVMRAGASVDANIGAAWTEGMRRRHAGIARMVHRLSEAGMLGPDVDGQRAADVIAALVTDEVCDVLVQQRGWTFQEYETWLHQTMTALVV